MNTWVRRSLNAGALTAGALLAATAPAHAASADTTGAGTTATTAGNVGVLNGTQALAPIQVPVDICGNAVGALGDAIAECEGGAAALNPEWTWSRYEEEVTLFSAGNVGVGNGNQVYAPVQIPLNVCGNAIALLGDATASCEGGASASRGRTGRHAAPESTAMATTPKPQPPPAKPPAAKPPAAKKPPAHSGYDRPKTRNTGPRMVTAGNVGVANGNQVYSPIQIPINVCGLAIGVAGDAQAACDGGATAVRR